MLSVRSDQSLEPLALKVLEAVAVVTARLELRWFVAGAIARDIMLTGVFGLEAGRATRDVDLAVAVATWKEFDMLRRGLLATGSFQEAKRTAQRLYYRSAAGDGGYPLDLIPFGGVEGERSSIAWPPDGSEIMSVAGYEQALAAAVEVEVRPGLAVQVASIQSLAVLKIFAWNDRGEGDAKDAIDLGTLLRRYFDAGNLDRLYGSELRTLEMAGYDVELAGARLLGRDVRAIVTASTAEKLEQILQERADRLINHVARGFQDVDDSVTKAQQLIEQFRAGLQGA